MHRMCDVVVANVGLHSEQASTSDVLQLSEPILRSLGAFNARHRGRSELPCASRTGVALWRETTPQHFPPVRAERHAPLDALRVGVWHWTDKPPRRNATCAPFDAAHRGATPIDELPDDPVARTYRAVTARAQALDVPVLRLRQALASRFDAHPGVVVDGERRFLDCTHWCAGVLSVYDVAFYNQMKQHFC